MEEESPKNKKYILDVHDRANGFSFLKGLVSSACRCVDFLYLDAAVFQAVLCPNVWARLRGGFDIAAQLMLHFKAALLYPLYYEGFKHGGAV